MFTGLIERKGVIESISKEGGSGSLQIRATGWDRPIQVGESIAVQGVCLTVTQQAGDVLSFDVLAETFRCTNLGSKQVGSAINLERALRQGDPLGGHMVQGHVDSTGTVHAIIPVDRDFRVVIHCGAEIQKYIVYKGSIALDGISLTVADVDERGFTVHIIPHTWDVTTFSDLQVGDAVNLEADPLAKYVERALLAHRALLPVDWQAVQQGGYEIISNSNYGANDVLKTG